MTTKAQGDEEIRESERLFRTMTDSAPVMLWMSGPDALCTFFNEPWLKFRGRTMEQELGNGWTEGVHPDDLRRCLDTYLAAFSRRENFRMEYRLRRADGEYRWILDTGVPRFDENGSFAGYVGSCIDVTDLKRAAEERAELIREQAARVQAEAAEVKFRGLLEAAPSSIVISNRDGTIVLVNAETEHVFGYSRDELVGRSLDSLLPHHFWQQYVRPVLGSDLSQWRIAPNAATELRGRRKNGSELPIEISVSPLRTPEETLVICVIHDITERKHAEEELDAERRWLQAIIQHSPTGIIVLAGSHGEQVFANPRAEELFGRLLPTEGLTTGEYVPQLALPNGTPISYEETAGYRALRGEAVAEQEVLIHHADGRIANVLLDASAIRDAHGTIIGAVVVLEEITRIRELERLREEWTSLVAHDLRQPVTVIAGYADQLRRLFDRHASPADLDRSLAHIRAAVANLNRMIADLLDASRIEARRLTLEVQTVDLPTLVQAVIDRTAPVARGRSVRLVVRGPIPSLEIDPGRIEQVLDNLISNADKYGYPRSEILIEIEQRDRDVQVSVTNRGDGIPPEELPHVFTRFYRTREAQAGPVKGLGLGLYVSKGLVEAHGGRIWAESTPGRTTTFHFSLPVP